MSHQCRLDKNNSLSIFVAIKYIDSSTTHFLKYPKQRIGNQYWEGMYESSVSALQEQVILYIGSYQIHQLQYNLHAKISKTGRRQSILF